MTIDIPDKLHQQVKAKAAMESRTLKELVIDGLRRVLADEQPSRKHASRRTEYPIIKSRGTGEKITNELVEKAIDDAYLEEADYYASFIRR